VTIENDY